MSRKTLLFCEQQTLWICRDTDWAEDLDLDGESYRFSDYSGLNRPRLKSPVFADGGNENAMKQVQSQSEGAPDDLSDAMTLIKCYSSRKLSYENDIKNAFEGLTWFMSSLSTDSLSEFLWGLPEPGFEAFLCWSPRADRRGSRGVVEKRTEFPEAPSWSWMVWLGEVKLPQFVLSTHGRGWKSIIKCYKYPTYACRQGREPDIIFSRYEAEETVLSCPYNILDGLLPLESESDNLVFWAEGVEVCLDVDSLSIHFEKYASSICSMNGKRLWAQNLNISEKLARDIRELGIVHVTVVGLAIEKSVSDGDAVVCVRDEPDQNEADPFGNWSRTVHCLLVSRSGNDVVHREGSVALRPVDWHNLIKTRELLVLAQA